MNHLENNSDSIQTITEAITALSEGERTEFAQIIKNINIPPNEFAPFASWSKECYTRNCIIDTEEFELILLCWEKGQVTPIHDHGGEECWVKAVQGEFKETIYQVNEKEELKEIRSAISKTGDITYMVDFMGCHRLENLSDGRSMSLHFYAKPIRSCQLFDEKTKTFVRKDLEYNTISDLMVPTK